jgi:hypothetical protein
MHVKSASDNLDDFLVGICTWLIFCNIWSLVSWYNSLIDMFLCELGQLYAFEKAHHLGQNSVDRCLRQFKTVLLQQLEKVRDSPLSLSLSLSISSA